LPDKDTPYTWLAAFTVHIAGRHEFWRTQRLAAAKRQGASEHRELRADEPGGVVKVQQQLRRQLYLPDWELHGGVRLLDVIAGRQRHHERVGRHFSVGFVGAGFKGNGTRVPAVRGGL
jgi:hypothetical protein